VEFFANGRKIGEVAMEFIQPPPPGQTQTFTFDWREPPPGTHALTARATDDRGTTGTSPPVLIKVAMSEPLPIVRVESPDPVAIEPRPDGIPNNASFRIRRFGPVGGALPVAYSLHGTATNGADYEMLSGLATIPAGQRSVRVTVRPALDGLAEGRESVILRLEPAPALPGAPVIPYRIGARRSAVAVILDGLSPAAPLAAAECTPLAGNLMEVCFPADPGHNFRLEASADLNLWETLFDAVAEEGVWHFIDDDMPAHRQRFYRLTPEPVAEADAED
jgi:hypothetical protein